MTAELASLAGRIRQIAQDCEALAEADVIKVDISASAISTTDDGQLARVAMGILRLRRERERLFGAGLFADPAWDMLLDLFVQHARARTVSVSSLGIAAAVPPTTAIRYMDALETQALILRKPWRRDGRVRHVELTAVALDRIRTLLTKMVCLLDADNAAGCARRPAVSVTRRCPASRAADGTPC